MDLTFELKIGTKLEDWFLDLGGVLPLVGDCSNLVGRLLVRETKMMAHFCRATSFIHTVDPVSTLL